MRIPAGTMKNGMTKAVRRASGSKIPLLRRADHSANLSVRAPPQYEPRRLPMRPGMLMRPFIAGLMLYGGAWKTDALVERAAR